MGEVPGMKFDLPHFRVSQGLSHVTHGHFLPARNDKDMGKLCQSDVQKDTLHSQETPLKFVAMAIFT